MSNPNGDHAPNGAGDHARHWWRWTPPKARIPLQVIAGQLIGWALRKLLGE